MGISSSIMKPQELTEFRKLNTSIENVDIPARPENRTLTDKKGFLFFGLPIVIFIPLFVYTLVKSDIRRLNYGYDNCGNLCGHNNTQIDKLSCSGIDMTSFPYQSFDRFNIPQCIAKCPDTEIVRIMPLRCEKEKELSNLLRDENTDRFRRDTLDDDIEISKNNFWNTLETCRKMWWKFVAVIFITIGLSLLMLCLLRFTPGVLIWSILILSTLVAVAATLGLWYAYSQQKDYEENPVTLMAAVGLSIFTVIIILMLMCLFKKIRLVILLFKEATKAVFAMPLLIFVPVLTTLVQLIVLLAFAVSTVWMSTSAELIKIRDDYYAYEQNAAMVFSLTLNVILTSWTLNFIVGFQYMTIAGSVASWFFAKNKQYLGSPICTSFLNAVKFHTGTIAFGSFILVLMAFVRALIKSLFDNDKLKCVLECCCDNIEAFLKYLSNNAYIETAIHGQSFLRSGRRAAKILMSNAASVIAINSVGDFVLGMIQFLIIIISTGIAVMLFTDMEYFWFPSIICFFINLIIVVVIFGVFTATIDTLFICFCEDKTINDGISRPYYMSRGLMEFIEDSKKVYGRL